MRDLSLATMLKIFDRVVALVIESIIFYHDLEELIAIRTIEQTKYSIEHYRDAEVEHEGKNDCAEKILECHAGLIWLLSSSSGTNLTIIISTKISEITPAQNP